MTADIIEHSVDVVALAKLPGLRPDQLAVGAADAEEFPRHDGPSAFRSGLKVDPARGDIPAVGAAHAPFRMRFGIIGGPANRQVDRRTHTNGATRLQLPTQQISFQVGMRLTDIGRVV